DFGDDAGERGLRDEGGRPELLAQFCLGKHSRAMVDQNPQQIERLGREMPLRVTLAELTRIGVERKLIKSNLHRARRAILLRPRQRLQSALIVAQALALVVTMTGITGVIAPSVAQRRRSWACVWRSVRAATPFWRWCFVRDCCSSSSALRSAWAAWRAKTVDTMSALLGG